MFDRFKRKHIERHLPELPVVDTTPVVDEATSGQQEIDEQAEEALSQLDDVRRKLREIQRLARQELLLRQAEVQTRRDID